MALRNFGKIHKVKKEKTKTINDFTTELTELVNRYGTDKNCKASVAEVCATLDFAKFQLQHRAYSKDSIKDLEKQLQLGIKP